MLLTTLLKDTVIDGTLNCECPHGQLEVRANDASRLLHLDFSNARVFRYFLDSLPGFSISRAAKYRNMAQIASFQLILSIDGKPLMKKNGAANQLDINYWTAGKQWILWKLGL